jgi:hypothetical protein
MFFRNVFRRIQFEETCTSILSHKASKRPTHADPYNDVRRGEHDTSSRPQEWLDQLTATLESSPAFHKLERFPTVRAVRVNKAMVNSRTVSCWPRSWLPLLRSDEAGLLTLVSIQKRWPIDPSDRPQSSQRLLWGRDVRRGGAMAYPSECISTRTSKAISSTMAYSRNVEC